MRSVVDVANRHGVDFVREMWGIALDARKEHSGEYPSILKELVDVTNWWMEARHDPTRTYELDKEGD